MFDELLSYTFIEYDKIIFKDKIDKGNAPVYKGKYDGLDVAIKEYEYKEYYIEEYLLFELNIGSNLKSNRLMKVYGYSYDNDKKYVYLIMEYINSSNLWRYINHNNYSKYVNINESIIKDLYINNDKYGKWAYIMPRKTKISIIISLLKAVRAMWNEGIIHGDLKPGNLVIKRSNDEIFLKVIDYGTCYKTDQIQLDYCCGTDGFTSPELNYDYILSHKSDIYAVGVIIVIIWFGQIKHCDYKKSRNDLLKKLRIIKKKEPNLEKLLRKCINSNYKKRPDIYKLYNEFILI